MSGVTNLPQPGGSGPRGSFSADIIEACLQNGNIAGERGGGGNEGERERVGKREGERE